MTPRPERKPMRLPKYDYSRPGAYFITACAKDREFLFESTEAKQAVESVWRSLPDIFANIELAEFVVMPNHFHGDILIKGAGAYRLHPGTWKNDSPGSRDGQLPVPTADENKFETLSNIIGAFKTTAATRVNKLRGVIGVPVWQKSFYDRIIRDVSELQSIEEYIRNNPTKWAEDRDNPAGWKLDLPAKSIDAYWKEIFEGSN